MFLIVLADWKDFFNYPGLELWKFINLTVFLTAAVLILRKPISSALQSRKESIRAQIQKALEEKAAAEQKLAEAEELLVRLPADVQTVKYHAEEEARAERERQAAAADREIERLRNQAERELEAARKVSKKELQKFLANRSVELARQSVVSQLDSSDDLRLIRDRVAELGRGRV